MGFRSLGFRVYGSRSLEFPGLATSAANRGDRWVIGKWKLLVRVYIGIMEKKMETTI